MFIFTILYTFTCKFYFILHYLHIILRKFLHVNLCNYRSGIIFFGTFVQNNKITDETNC